MLFFKSLFKLSSKKDNNNESKSNNNLNTQLQLVVLKEVSNDLNTNKKVVDLKESVNNVNIKVGDSDLKNVNSESSLYKQNLDNWKQTSNVPSSNSNPKVLDQKKKTESKTNDKKNSNDSDFNPDGSKKIRIFEKRIFKDKIIYYRFKSVGVCG